MRKLCFSKFARLPSLLFSYDAHCHLVSSLWLFSFSASDSEIESDSEEPRRSQPVAARFSPQVMKKSKVLLSASLYRESLFWARGRGFKPSQTAKHSRVLNKLLWSCLLALNTTFCQFRLTIAWWSSGVKLLALSLLFSHVNWNAWCSDLVSSMHVCCKLAHPRL